MGGGEDQFVTYKNKVNSHKCDQCGYASSRKDTLKRHVMTAHKIGEKQLKCNQLRSHMLVHDKTKIRYLSCEDCGDRFLRKSNLASHKKKYHKTDEKPPAVAGIVLRPNIKWR